MTPIVERIQILFLNNAEKPTQVFQKLGMPKNALSIWKTGKASPSTNAIIKISNYFSVSTDYLLTGKIQTYDLPSDEIKLLKCYRELPDIGKEKVISYIDGYISAIHGS